MSTWTHVAGILRIDALQFTKEGKFNFKEIFQSKHYEDFLNGNKNCNMPCGSEGSLDWSLWKNPDKEHLAAYTISIFGDLRDFGKDNINTIIDWFKRTCNKFDIRQAIIEIQPEDDDNITIVNITKDNYDFDKHKSNYVYLITKLPREL